jgi:hypothetical protein
VASALFDDQAAEQRRENAASAEAPEKVLAAVRTQATRTDLLVVCLSGVLRITGRGKPPEPALVDPRQRRITTPPLDIAEVLAGTPRTSLLTPR